MGAYFEADYEWFSFFKYFEHFFCWPPAWELLWSWILMSSGVNTHCDPPSCTFSDPFSSNRIFQKFPPLWPTQRILHFLWKIKLCNLLLDPSEPTPPSLSLFIDSTALQWEKNSQADGLAQKTLKRFTADIKNSNVATQTSVQKGTWWKLRVSSPSLGLLLWPRPLIKVLLCGFHRCVLTLLTLQFAYSAYSAYTAINISTINVCIRSYPKYVHSMNFNAPPLIRVPFCIVKYAGSIIFINMCIKRLDLRVQRIQQM